MGQAAFLQHIISSICYCCLLYTSDKFTYYIEVHDEVADAEIFPFLIQVYVENAAKQALMADEKMLISVQWLLNQRRKRFHRV